MSLLFNQYQRQQMMANTRIGRKLKRELDDMKFRRMMQGMTIFAMGLIAYRNRK